MFGWLQAAPATNLFSQLQPFFVPEKWVINSPRGGKLYVPTTSTAAGGPAVFLSDYAR